MSQITADRLCKEPLYGFRVKRIIKVRHTFLPAAGYRNNSDLNNAGSNGNYWSSSANDNNNNAYNLNFNSGNHDWNNNNRNNGFSVRPVSALAFGAMWQSSLIL